MSRRLRRRTRCELGCGRRAVEVTLNIRWCGVAACWDAYCARLEVEKRRHGMRLVPPEPAS